MLAFFFSLSLSLSLSRALFCLILVFSASSKAFLPFALFLAVSPQPSDFVLLRIQDSRRFTIQEPFFVKYTYRMYSEKKVVLFSCSSCDSVCLSSPSSCLYLPHSVISMHCFLLLYGVAIDDNKLP